MTAPRATECNLNPQPPVLECNQVSYELQQKPLILGRKGLGGRTVEQVLLQIELHHHLCPRGAYSSQRGDGLVAFLLFRRVVLAHAFGGIGKGPYLNMQSSCVGQRYSAQPEDIASQERPQEIELAMREFEDTGPVVGFEHLASDGRAHVFAVYGGGDGVLDPCIGVGA